MHKLMIVGESPSRTRPHGMENVAFSGKTSYILWDELNRYNISREDCFVTNVITDLLPEGEKPTEELIKRNWDRLEAEIKQEKPAIILAVGKKAAERVLQTEVESIVDLAGNILHCEDHPYYVIPCIHPGAIARKPQLKKDFIDSIYVAAETLKALEAEKDNQ